MSNVPAVILPSDAVPAPLMSATMAAVEAEKGRTANLWQRAGIFAASALVPEHFRGKREDCYIALSIADRMGEDGLLVMQNIYMVSGKPGWAAQYMVARMNRSGLLRGRIRWTIETLAPDVVEVDRRVKTGWDQQTRKPIYQIHRAKVANLRVTARAIMADTGDEESFTVDTAMAVAEKWVDNEKYTSMPEVMLRYRAATFLIRFTAPEVMLGLQTREELEDSILTVPAQVVSMDPIPQPGRSRFAATVAAALPAQPAEPEPFEPEPEAEPAPTREPAAMPGQVVSVPQSRTVSPEEEERNAVAMECTTLLGALPPGEDAKLRPWAQIPPGVALGTLGLDQLLSYRETLRKAANGKNGGRQAPKMAGE